MKQPLKGFSYYLEDEKIISYLRLKPKEKLEWLEDIAQLNKKALYGTRRVVWEKLRKGEV